MKVTTVWIGIFVLFVCLYRESKAAEEWQGYFNIQRLGSVIASSFSSRAPTNSEEQPDCFIRTQYVPQEYGINAEVLLTFDLSDENVEKMRSLWYCVQSYITERNVILEKSMRSKLIDQLRKNGYVPSATLNKDQLILDSYCVLAKQGFPEAFCQLSYVFDDSMYGQRRDTKLGYLFRQYRYEVGTVEAMRQGQLRCRVWMAEEELEESDDEEYGTPPTARNSSDEFFEDSKTAAHTSQKIRKKID